MKKMPFYISFRTRGLHTHLLMGKILALSLILLLSGLTPLRAQEEEKKEEEKKEEKDKRPVRPTFESVLLIDNQSVMVPAAKTLEFDIMHRFGRVEKGFSDLFGLYASSNIRLGLSYTPIKNLSVGLGTTKFGKLQDASLKYALLTQTRSSSIPISVTYYVDMVYDARAKENFRYTSDRLSYFHQLILARKLGNRISFQVAPSLTHFNTVEEVENESNQKVHMENNHFAVAVSGRVKFSAKGSVIVGVDQPITKHKIYNPNPNVSFGVELATSGHAFQIFAGNYGAIVPTHNNFFNSNNYWNSENNSLTKNFILGFNITRLWGL